MGFVSEADGIVVFFVSSRVETFDGDDQHH